MQHSDDPGNLGIVGRIILKWILEEWVVKSFIGFSCLRIGLIDRYQCVDECMVSVKGGRNS
jgi:hypothetical protein